MVPSGTSDDETDHGEWRRTGGFIVRFVDWRSMELTQFLMDLDDLATLDRYHPDTKTRGRGNIVRHRLRVEGLPGSDSVFNWTEPPVDLPSNCYSATWVQSLCEGDRLNLIANAKPPISLTIDQFIKR